MLVSKLNSLKTVLGIVKPLDKSCHIQQLPLDVIRLIFLFIAKTQDLGRCARVCKEWNAIIEEPVFWKKRLGSNVVENLSPFVQKGSVSWLEASHCIFLSTFIDALWIAHHTKKDNWNDFCLLNPILKQGNFRFSICQSTNVEIAKKGEDTIKLIREAGQKIISLAIEGDILFALGKDGTVVTWNYRTRKRIQDIELTYAKEHPDFKKNYFYVQNDLIIVKYGNNGKHVLEVIAVANPSQTQIIEDESIPLPLKIMIEKNVVFILGINKLFIYDLSSKEKFALDKSQLRLNQMEFFFDMTLFEDTLVISSSEEKIYLINKKTLKIIKSYPLSTSLKIKVVDNLVYGAAYNQINVLNLLDGKIVKKIEFFFKDEEINSTAIAELIETTRKNRREMTLTDRRQMMETQKNKFECLIS